MARGDDGYRRSPLMRTLLAESVKRSGSRGRGRRGYASPAPGGRTEAERDAVGRILALSIWQPWASLIAIGAKNFETRSWMTRYRGDVLICAGKRQVDQVTRERWREEPWFEELLPEGPDGLPMGAAVAVVRLSGCVNSAHVRGLSAREDAFGYWGPGQWGWELRDVRRLEVPVPIRGQQGFFEVPEEVRVELRRQGVWGVDGEQ